MTCLSRQCNDDEREAILSTLRKALEDDPRILFAYVHGSFLSEGPFHDIDVAIYVDDSVGTVDQFQATLISERAEEMLVRAARETKPPYRVDVSLLNEAPIGFCYHVFQGRLLIDRNEALRTSILERTLSQYLDMKPLRRRALREAMTSWN
jgi:predicted nucleotidyltransferase